MHVRSARVRADSIRGEATVAGPCTSGTRARRAIALSIIGLLVLASCGSDQIPPGHTAASTAQAGDGCDWPMWGQNLDRTFAYPCDSAITPASVGDLQQTWFFNTDDVVTASPAVVGDTAYVGDWSG